MYCSSCRLECRTIKRTNRSHNMRTISAWLIIIDRIHRLSSVYYKRSTINNNNNFSGRRYLVLRLSHSRMNEVYRMIHKLFSTLHFIFSFNYTNSRTVNWYEYNIMIHCWYLNIKSIVINYLKKTTNLLKLFLKNTVFLLCH